MTPWIILYTSVLLLLVLLHIFTQLYIWRKHLDQIWQKNLVLNLNYEYHPANNVFKLVISNEVDHKIINANIYGLTHNVN